MRGVFVFGGAREPFRDARLLPSRGAELQWISFRT
jgi:hypothetical protein